MNIEEYESAEYYLNTWINGNKSHVIDTLSKLLVNKSRGSIIEYNCIIKEFTNYDSELTLNVINRVNSKIYSK